MPLTKEKLKIRKGRYRSVFATSNGRWVLGDILFDMCRFGMPADEQDIATRQAVGMEMLFLMDMLAGQGQTATPEQFINKLMRGGEEQRKVKKEKR